MIKRIAKGCFTGLIIGLLSISVPVMADTERETAGSSALDTYYEEGYSANPICEAGYCVINVAMTPKAASPTYANWKKVSQTLTHDPRFDKMNQMYGIDVSVYQGGDINWEKVKADGIDYVILRCGFRSVTSGLLYKDKYFAKNVEGAYKAGLKVGAYLFAQDTTVEEAKESAKYTLDIIKDYRKYISFPVYYDFEGVNSKYRDDEVINGKTVKYYYYLHSALAKADKANVSYKDWFSKIAKVYCDEVAKAGYVSGIYSDGYELETYLNINSLSKTYPIWMARFSSVPKEPYKDGYYEFDYDIWQYNAGSGSQKYYGTVAGIGDTRTIIDLDVLYLDPKPAATKITKTSSFEESLTVYWKKMSFVDGYQVTLYDVEKKSVTSKKVLNTTDAKCTLSDLQSGTRYLVRVRPFYVNDKKEYTYGSYTEYKNVYTKPLQVTELKASTINAESIKLSWKAVHGATHYDVECYDKSGKLIGTEIATGNTYTYKNLKSSTFYKFDVRAYYMSEENTKISGAFSTKLDVKTKPAQVKGVAQTAAKEGSITLKWESVTGAEGYEIVCMDEKDANIGSVDITELEYKYTGLADSKSYKFKVRAYYTLDGKKVYGSYSAATVMRTKIPAITEITQTDAKATSITYSWAKNSVAQGYKATIYNMDKKALETQYPTENKVTFEGLDPAKKYLVRVTTCYGEKTDVYYLGTYSSYYEVYAAPSQVEEVTYTTGVNDITLSWKATEPNTVGYQIQKLDIATGKYVGVGYSDTTTFKVEQLESSKRHVFKVRGYILANGKTKKYGTASVACLADTKPEKVKNVAVKKNSANNVELTWEKASNVTGYEIRRYNEKGELLDKLLSDTNAVKYEGLASATKYQFAVRAYYVNPEGTKFWGAGSSKLEMKSLPDKVQGVHQTGATTTSVTLSWNKVSRVKGYEVICYDKAGKKLGSSFTTATTLKYTGLKVSTGYVFKVRAFYEISLNGKTTKVNGASTSNDKIVTLPDQVKDFTATTAATSVTLSWRKVTGAKGYQVAKWDSAKGKYVTIATTTGNSYKITGLSSAATYKYKVRAYVFKNETSKMYGKYTEEKVVYTKPEKVTNVVKKTTTTSSITLSWSKVNKAKGYEVVCYDKNGKKLGSKTTTSTTFKYTGLSHNKSYTFKVRAYYVKDGKTIYGSMSKGVSVKTK